MKKLLLALMLSSSMFAQAAYIDSVTIDNVKFDTKSFIANISGSLATPAYMIIDQNFSFADDIYTLDIYSQDTLKPGVVGIQILAPFENTFNFTVPSDGEYEFVVNGYIIDNLSGTRLLSSASTTFSAVSSVPEPNMSYLMIAGLIGLFGTRRKQSS